MKLGVTYKKNDDGSVGLLVGNIGTDVYIPTRRLRCCRSAEKLGRNACLFPLFLMKGASCGLTSEKSKANPFHCQI